MNDEQNSGTGVPVPPPVTVGAFDWLVESHQASAPLAPLTDDAPPAPPVAPPQLPVVPTPFPQSLATAPPPTVQPQTVQPQPAQPQPAQPIIIQQPVEQPSAESLADPPMLPPPSFEQVAPAREPVPLPPVAQQPRLRPVDQHPQPAPASIAQAGTFSFAAEPLAPSTFGAGSAGGPAALALERHTEVAKSGNAPLDWIAFILAFLAPPLGLLLGIAAVVVGTRSRGYSVSIAKAAIGIGAALSVVLAVGVVVETKISSDQAAHTAVVASSKAWCTKLESVPGVLSSATLGWPAAADTIPDTLAAIDKFKARWTSLAKLAPAGIRADTQKFATTAASIEASVNSTQTLDDAGNVAQLQNLVSTTGIHAWVSNYCG